MVQETRSSTWTGTLSAVAAYCIWGLMPLYWRELTSAAPLEVLAHRIIWSFVFISLGLIVAGRFGETMRVMRRLVTAPSESGALILVLAALFASANWLVHIVGVGSGRVVELGFGMFLTPLATVAIGVVVFSEKLTGLRLLAVGCAACGVGVLVAGLDRFPWIAILVSSTWAVYGALKKKVRIPAGESVAIEHALMTVPALVLLAASPAGYAAHFAGGFESGLSLFLIGSGLVTSIPMVLFSLSAQRLPMTLLGIIQYINPVLTFALGVVVFDEPLGTAEKAATLLILAAVVLYAASTRQKV